MKEILERTFFPFVEKPVRYVGQEFGIQRKDTKGKVQIALSYPDLYEIGMSYPGGHILYHRINQNPQALCERVYAPAPDAEKLLRDNRLSIFTLESFRPLKAFDVIGFTLSYELVYTNMLAILDLADIPLLARERSDSDPLIAAGGPICFNPEPTADLIDFFFIGDAEEGVNEIIDVLQSTRELPRAIRLEKIAGIESVYVPSHYDPVTRQALADGVPERIKARHVNALKNEYYPDLPLVPLTEIAHDRIAVEIMRGCPQGCQFCQAGKIYKPVRIRRPADIKTQTELQLARTGYDEVTLLSLSTTDYPDIAGLAVSIGKAVEAKNAALSLPSLRPDTFSPEVADAVSHGRKPGLTFAPEAGSQRLRDFIRKDITENDLLAAVKTAYERGWQNIKLYFMIGLPTETDDDLKAIITLIHAVDRVRRSFKGRHVINVTISPFSPKPHTPFQWDKLPDPEEIEEKHARLKSLIRSRTVTLKFRDPHMSYLEGILGRGDRCLGPVILEAYKLGARLDGWTEYFDFGKWKEAFANVGVEPQDYAKSLSFDAPLPWDHIDRGQSMERLREERSNTAAKQARSPYRPPNKSEIVSSTLNHGDEGMFGRRKKRVASSRPQITPTLSKIRIKWGRSGLARFASHKDNNRNFELAIRRAGIPVAYTQGFHPHQRLSFGPPLPVGYSSETEFLDIQTEDTCPADKIDALRGCLPEGYEILDHCHIYSKTEAISSMLNRAVYRIRGEFGDPAVVSDKIMEILDRPNGFVMRQGKKDSREVDIRPAIFRLEIAEIEGRALIEMELGLGDAGYARPNEVLRLMRLYDDRCICGFHFHRKTLYRRDENDRALDPMATLV